MMGGATLKPGEVWVARTDGDAHLQARSGRGRTACGQPAVDQRWDTPGRPKCAACIAAAGGAPVIAPAPVTASPASSRAIRHALVVWLAELIQLAPDPFAVPSAVTLVEPPAHDQAIAVAVLGRRFRIVVEDLP